MLVELAARMAARGTPRSRLMRAGPRTPAMMTSATPVRRSGRMRMTREAARPTCRPTSAMTKVHGAEDRGRRATGSTPSRPRLAPARTLSGAQRHEEAECRARRADRRSSVAAASGTRGMIEIHDRRRRARRPRRYSAVAADRVAPVVPDRGCPPSGATASQNPNIERRCCRARAPVEAVARRGRSPSAKLSRLMVNPRMKRLPTTAFWRAPSLRAWQIADQKPSTRFSPEIRDRQTSHPRVHPSVSTTSGRRSRSGAFASAPGARALQDRVRCSGSAMPWHLWWAS